MDSESNSVTNSATDAGQSTNLSRDIFNKINEVRMNPIKIANKLTQVMSESNKRDNILIEPISPPQ